MTCTHRIKMGDCEHWHYISQQCRDRVSWGERGRGREGGREGEGRVGGEERGGEGKVGGKEGGGKLVSEQSFCDRMYTCTCS